MLAEQEENVLHMIESHDIEGLKLLLTGKGDGRLVMSAPTPELAKVWLSRIQSVCSNTNCNFDSEDFKSIMQQNNAAILEHDNAALVGTDGSDGNLVMSGTMEKAARSETGKLVRWRQRFFVLQVIYSFIGVIFFIKAML